MLPQVEVDENGKIVDARFKTFGCGSAIASSSLATEWVKGKTVRELRESCRASHVPVFVLCWDHTESALQGVPAVLCAVETTASTVSVGQKLLFSLGNH